MKIVTGNLLDVKFGTILHQVNCRGIVGGLAGVLQRKHPTAFIDYFLLSEKYGTRNIGSFHEGHANRALSIIHIFGQIEPGRNTDMPAVRIALQSIINRPLLQPIYAPFCMGCGLGGGNWHEYSKMLTSVFPDLVVIRLPEEREEEESSQLT